MLLTHTPAGDQLLRIAIRPQLDGAEEEARSKLSSQPIPTPPPTNQLPQSRATLPSIRPASSLTTQPRPAATSRTAGEVKKKVTRKGSQNLQDDAGSGEAQNNAIKIEDSDYQAKKPKASNGIAPLDNAAEDGREAPINQQIRPGADSLNRQTKSRPARDYKKQ